MEIWECDIHHTREQERHCLRCWLPRGASNIKSDASGMYSFDVDGVTMYARQDQHSGWHEVAPPRKD